MSMKKHGNKEAKKPKKAKPLVNPDGTTGVTEAIVAASSDRTNKKK